ncbi:MAG: bidirectional hydrogenase complex protein HoxE [Chloroflexota bacterium]|jgi:bidirectional [NiFe] hydrogenase diaphorase subunit|nr:bidirectional hydrogenase complex protein HoxE [Chloroflexota bacterium]
MTTVKTDTRYKLVEATLRRHGYSANALIEGLHTVQEAWGYLDPDVLRWLARTLKLPMSKVYGVATFYNRFVLKPQGEHSCVVCLGTACYIKGALNTLKKIEHDLHLTPGMTTADQRVSLLKARCMGSCGLAPVVVMDGALVGKVSPEQVTERLQEWLA